MPLCVRHGIIGLAAVLATGLAEPAGAMRRWDTERIETVAARPAGEPIMAIVSLSNQRVTIYDADGWILRALVSSGQSALAPLLAERRNDACYKSPFPFHRRRTEYRLACAMRCGAR